MKNEFINEALRNSINLTIKKEEEQEIFENNDKKHQNANEIYNNNIVNNIHLNIQFNVNVDKKDEISLQNKKINVDTFDKTRK